MCARSHGDAFFFVPPLCVTCCRSPWPHSPVSYLLPLSSLPHALSRKLHRVAEHEYVARQRTNAPAPAHSSKKQTPPPLPSPPAPHTCYVRRAHLFLVLPFLSTFVPFRPLAGPLRPDDSRHAVPWMQPKTLVSLHYPLGRLPLLSAPPPLPSLPVPPFLPFIMTADASVDTSLSGTTLVSVCVRGNKLVLTNVGDSRATLGRRRQAAAGATGEGGGCSLVAQALTEDHKPDIPVEVGGERGDFCGFLGGGVDVFFAFRAKTWIFLFLKFVFRGHLGDAVGLGVPGVYVV